MTLGQCVSYFCLLFTSPSPVVIDMKLRKIFIILVKIAPLTVSSCQTDFSKGLSLLLKSLISISFMETFLVNYKDHEVLVIEYAEKKCFFVEKEN